MKTEEYILKKWHLVIILLAGTIIRFIYGYSSKAWLGAPDQLAWGLSIDEMLHSKTWSYIQLIHAPHEGGSFLISLVSILFRPLQFILPSLSFTALLIDTIARLIQIKITQKLFGNETACWFGAWTIASVPLLIPWATVNFGLHSLFSFVPFVFFYFAIIYKENKYLPVLCGIISGIAVSFSYDSVVLVAVSILFLLFATKNLKVKLFNILIFFIACILVLLPHVFTRVYLNTGGALDANPAFSIRGVPLDDLFTAPHFGNLCTVWFTSLPGSYLLSSLNFLPAGLSLVIMLLFLFTGILFYVLSDSIKKETKLLSLCILILFLAAYAFSPFYGGSYHNKSYVYYRHLCYIVPFVTAIMITGFIHSGKFKLYLLTAWIILCSVASFQYISATPKITQPAYRAAGWVLAKKYGDHVNKLFQIHAITETRYQDELLIGFGWGLSAAILQNKSDSGSIEKLIQVVKQCPEKYKPEIIQGVRYSFAKGITPVLDPELLTLLDFRLPAK